uniref:Axin_b-cat_bind domain-containing protein n=1 Tax=Schistosoma curassoni TaxID=6186 RepID=A0A183JWE1_9TREM
MNETNSSTIQQSTLNYPYNSTLIMNTGSQLLNSVNKFQNAQEILDDHCSRIWADESDMNIDTQLLLSYSKRQQNNLMHTPTTYYCFWWVTYRSFSRPNKADLRSIASWDSGVVSNYYEKKHRLHHHHNHHRDDLDIMDDTVDTASILEAASLQALSSSTTELALVNGEVTAKLVEKIIRHYPRGIFDGDDDYVRKNHTNTSEKSYFKSSQFKETSTLNHAYPFSNSRLRRRSKQCESFYESPSLSLSYPVPGVNLNSTCSVNNTTTATTGNCQQHPGIMIPCECHRCIHCTHSPSTLNDHLSANYCNCNYIHQLNDKPQHSTTCHSQQLPIITASDTSSTFDSGISSAYDQLPLRKHVNNNRENRSQYVFIIFFT